MATTATEPTTFHEIPIGSSSQNDDENNQQQQQDCTSVPAAKDHGLNEKEDQFISHEQPNSLSSENSSSGNSSLPPSPAISLDSSTLGSQQQQQLEQPIKCSAVHTLERDMPDFDYSHLVSELKQKIVSELEQNVGLFNHSDLEKCRQDDWFVARFLLRNKLNVSDAFEMMKKALRYSNEQLGGHMQPNDFPAEFYQLGGLFSYEPDRKGNRMLYMRVCLHSKTPEIVEAVQAYIYNQLKWIDDEANGKGISVVIDCTNGGLVNADMETLLFVVNTLKNYFPKGLSYFLIHELPWILKPFWHIAKTWIPDEYKQMIKFSDSRSIYEYIDRENLPDFMGGTCQRPYVRVPDNCVRLEEVSKLWGLDHQTIRKVFVKFQDNLPDETVQRLTKYFDECDQKERDEQLKQLD